jgi:hypothetical protein
MQTAIRAGKAKRGGSIKYGAYRSFGRYVASGSERLEYLASFLELASPERVTFSRWYGSGKGCAVGLAAVQEPRIQAQGLSLADEESLKECRPVYRQKSDWEAVTTFFGISHEDATLLFTPAGYHGELRPHPRRIAERIRGYLRDSAGLPGSVASLVPA